MKKRCVFLLCAAIHWPCMAEPALQSLDVDALSLMTANDISTHGASNLNLTNHTGQALTVYGVYLYGVAFIQPGLDCINGIAAGSNSTIQAYMSGLVTPIHFTAGQSVPIGENYLYNLLYF